MYSKKKILSTFALAAVAANLGLASLAFAQESTIGTQNVGCPDAISGAYEFEARGPANFSFAPHAAVATYETSTRMNIDGPDNFKIVSNISPECVGTAGLPSVSLTASANDAFKVSPGTLYLSNTGNKGNLGDQQAILSLSFGGVNYANATFINCDEDSPAPGEGEDSQCFVGEALDGSVNAFDSATVGGFSPTTEGAPALLIDADGADRNEVTLFSLFDPDTAATPVAGVGFLGELEITNLQYHIAVPGNVAPETYTAQIFYTLQ